MRVSFCGPSGTGKTTLAEYVAKRFDLPLNPIGARSVSKAMGFASPYDVDAAGKRGEFQRQLIAQKVAWEAEHDAFVTDRTPFDNITYTVMHDHKAIDAELLAAAGHGIRRYTHVVQCTLDTFHHTGDDSARVHDLTYHEIFEAVLTGFLGRHVSDMRWHILECSSLDARQIEVRSFLGQD